MPETYVQCILQRGNELTVGWILRAHAEVGTHVTLPAYGAGWWHIDTVYGSMVATAAEISEKQHAHRAFQGSLKGGGIDER